jgi:hypothetical protein
MRRWTYHVGNANNGFPAVHNVLNGAAKIAGLLLDGGQSHLDGNLAAAVAAMDLEGLELAPLMVVDYHPLPIDPALLLGA